MAQAFLTHQYELKGDQGMYTHTPSKTMRTIEIQTKRGKPLMVLESEDNRGAIEETLKRNNWQITAWNGESLQLISVMTAANSQKAVHEVAVAKPSHNKKAGISCLIIIGAIVTIAIIAALLSSLLSPPYDHPAEARSACSDMFDARFPNSLDIQLEHEKTSRVVDSDTDRNWIVRGNAKVSEESGKTINSRYICYVYYDVTTEKINETTSGLTVIDIDR